MWEEYSDSPVLWLKLLHISPPVLKIYVQSHIKGKSLNTVSQDKHAYLTCKIGIKWSFNTTSAKYLASGHTKLSLINIDSKVS